MQGRSAGAPAHLPSRTALGRGDDAKMGEGHAFRTLWTRSKHGQTSDTREITASGAVEREEVCCRIFRLGVQPDRRGEESLGWND
mgnify:CR=1 FL=1